MKWGGRFGLVRCVVRLFGSFTKGVQLLVVRGLLEWPCRRWVKALRSVGKKASNRSRLSLLAWISTVPLL